MFPCPKLPKSIALGLLLFSLSALDARLARAQDQQPSLGEVARQARKDKEKNPTKPKQVITDETIATSKEFNGIGDIASSQSGSDAMAKGLAGLESHRWHPRQARSDGPRDAGQGRAAGQ